MNPTQPQPTRPSDPGELRIEQETVLIGQFAARYSVNPSGDSIDGAGPRKLQSIAKQRIVRYDFGEWAVVEGTGLVARAHDSILGRDVDIRVLATHDRSPRHQVLRFIGEAQLLARLEHPNIPAVHDFGFADDTKVFFSTSRVAGHTLGDVLQAQKDGDTEALAEYPLHRLLTVLLRAADAIGYAHSQGAVHGNLTPEAFVIGRHGKVYVVGWSKATTHTGGVDSLPLQIPGALATPVSLPYAAFTDQDISPFTAPELFAGDTIPKERRADVYSLAVTIYELLSNDLPYKVRNLDDDEVREVVRRDDPAALREKNPDIPRPVAAAVMWGLSKQCVGEEKRPDARMFHDCLGGRLVAPRPATGWKRWRIAAALLMLAAIGSGGWLWSQQEPPGDPRPTPTVKPIAAGPLLLWLDAHPQALDAKWRWSGSQEKALQRCI